MKKPIPPAPKTLNGVTLYVAVGAWAPPKIHRLNGYILRICLGWLSIGLMKRDVEAIIGLAGHIIATENARREEAA